MILRTRNVFLAWLVAGALQLMLLGVPGAPAHLGIGTRDARSQSEGQSASVGKRVHASEFTHRRGPTTPFLPSACVRLDLPALAGGEALVTWPSQAAAIDRNALPPARAPPALS